MPSPLRRRRTTASVLALGVLGLAAPLAATSAGALAPESGSPRAAGGECAPLFAKAMPASKAEARNPKGYEQAARSSAVGKAEFEEHAEDEAFWVDRCGKALYVEESLTPRQQQRVEKAADKEWAVFGRASIDNAITANALALESRPGAPRTIYLDFDGDSLSGSAWNDPTTGQTIVSPPYDTDGNPSVFSDAERLQIVRAWQSVAEDYAPFDVNVTTKDPGLAALDRTSLSDQIYGSKVVITPRNTVYTNVCGSGCGGVAYTGVFNLDGPDHMRYLPAWVFTDGVTPNAKPMAEAVAHEVGHSFGLFHDGGTMGSYSMGAPPFAPIMGAGYYEPITQWNKGEYAGASNTENDLAVIATGAPVIADDFASTTASAAPLTTSAPIDGLITTAADTDAFKFTAAGSTTVTVRTAAYFPNLDTKLTVLDANTGAVVATAAPAVSKVSSTQANGLGASVSFTAPSAGAAYVAVVDGVGNGDPTTLSGYSDYGSLGNYTISLITGTPGTSTAQPVAITTTSLPAARLSKAYTATIATSGGTGTFTWTRTGTLPGGLTWRVSADTKSVTISGKPNQRASFGITVTVRDASGGTATRNYTIAVK